MSLFMGTTQMNTPDIITHLVAKFPGDIAKASAAEFVAFCRKELSSVEVESVLHAQRNLGARLSDGTEVMLCPTKSFNSVEAAPSVPVG